MNDFIFFWSILALTAPDTHTCIYYTYMCIHYPPIKKKPRQLNRYHLTIEGIYWYIHFYFMHVIM